MVFVCSPRRRHPLAFVPIFPLSILLAMRWSWPLTLFIPFLSYDGWHLLFPRLFWRCSGLVSDWASSPTLFALLACMLAYGSQSVKGVTPLPLSSCRLFEVVPSSLSPASSLPMLLRLPRYTTLRLPSSIPFWLWGCFLRLPELSHIFFSFYPLSGLAMVLFSSLSAVRVPLWLFLFAAFPLSRRGQSLPPLTPFSFSVSLAVLARLYSASFSGSSVGPPSSPFPRSLCGFVPLHLRVLLRLYA